MNQTTFQLILAIAVVLVLFAGGLFFFQVLDKPHQVETQITIELLSKARISAYELGKTATRAAEIKITPSIYNINQEKIDALANSLSGFYTDKNLKEYLKDHK